MPEDSKKAEKNLFEIIVDWFKGVADWVQENLGDPALAATLRSDLGLAEGESIPANQKNQFTQFAADLDPDKESFKATVEELTAVVQAFIELGDSLDGLDKEDAWEVFYTLGMVATAESIRLRAPWAYALGKALLFVSDNYEEVDQFDPAVIVGAMSGQPPPAGSGEVLYQRVFAGVWIAMVLVEYLLEEVANVDEDIVDMYYGWDPDPASATPQADLVSGRALTMMVGTPGDIAAQLGITILGVPPEHEGPAVFLSFGGSFSAEQEVGDTTYKFQAGVTGALDLIIPFGDSPLQFEANGDPSGFVRLDVVRGNALKPAFQIGSPTGTRIDVGKLGYGVEIGATRAAFRFGFEEAAFIIDLADGDGFLSQLPGGQIKVDFGAIFIADTEHGLRIEGGTGAKAILPVNSSLFGVFTIQHLELALGPGAEDRDLAIELSGAFALNIGPFRATVDRLGLLVAVAIREGNLGIIDADFGFKPPSGIGLSLDAGVVKGGGYLYIDPGRGEYAGALELKAGPVVISALGILSTSMPDGSPGWSLLLLIYGQFTAVQLSFGFTLTGVGGIIGVQHAVSISALETGLRQGVLDDILFPQNPVADAPRIINRLRTVFPATPRALTIGPMVELGWGTPSIMIIRLGIILQIDNVVGGSGSIEFTRFVLVGQLIVAMPPAETKGLKLLKLKIDFLGYYDADEKRLGFQARLRDSYVGLGETAKVDLMGMFVIVANFGEEPSFIMAAGGFHPRFNDLPPGLPAPIDRVGAKFPIGIVKLTLLGYFAVTPSTVQVGAELRAKAKIGPVSLDGWLGFDAIFYFEPRFYFEVDIRGGVAIKFKGHKLASVELKMTLSGPGLWRATGKVSFSILWWDVSKSFNVTIGSAPDAPIIATDVQGLVRNALSEPGNWSAQLPSGGEAWVTLGPISGVDGLLAHPLGRVSALQRIAPFNLTLEKFGETRVAGPNRFEIDTVTIGSRVVSSPSLLSQPFARAHFVEMSDDDKLTSPSFEKLPAGFAVGTDAYKLPSNEVAADLDYETKILEPANELRVGLLIDVELLEPRLLASEVAWQAKMGAVARSDLRIAERLRSGPIQPIRVSEPPLTVATTTTMVEAASLEGTAVHSTAAAHQVMVTLDDHDVQLVEAYEVV